MDNEEETRCHCEIQKDEQRLDVPSCPILLTAITISISAQQLLAPMYSVERRQGRYMCTFNEWSYTYMHPDIHLLGSCFFPH